MIGGRISQRYAQAMLRIALDQRLVEGVGEQLQWLATLWHEQRALVETLENPSYAASRRRTIIERLAAQLQLLPTLRQLLLLLHDRGRIALLPDIARSYAAAADRHLGRVRAHVTSATPLDAEALGRLTRALELRTGQQVLLTSAVDPSLLGGFSTRIGSLLIDGSVRARLAQLGQTLLANKA